MTLLTIKGLSHQFHQVKALEDIHLTLQAGEVHALVGENGAGKSTLIKILSGIYPLQSGEIVVNGRLLDPSSPKASLAAGIGVIHQERQLIPAFTVAENMYLGVAYERRGLGIDRRGMQSKCQALMEEWGIGLDVKRLAGELSPAEKTMVEVARVLMRPCQLLILDEPTASLTDRETAVLFAVIEKLRREGTAILYVSHRLEEVFQLSERITVLRNGRLAATLLTRETHKAQLIELMTDAKPQAQLVPQPLTGETILSVEGLSDAAGVVKNAGFCLHRGEILGLFGLAGSGRTELLESIYGCRRIKNGTVTLAKERYQPTPKRSLARGMVLISEDRLGKALVGKMSIENNLLLATLDRYSVGGIFKRQAARADCQHMLGKLAIKAHSLSQPVNELSGGNQQKVVFARALLAQAQVFLCDEPTQAIDVGARSEIHRLLRAQASEGKAVLFVSSDLEETLEICDRLVVMANGCTGKVLENNHLSAEAVLACCYGEKTRR